MDKIINDYLVYSNLSVPTTITYTILKQPEIITIMNKINNIDVSILERKITNFTGDNVLNDKSSIVLISFLCCLMYKNNIFPQYIYDILKKLNINDVSIEELRQNSENLINILLDNSKGGGKKGGANFNVIFGKLLNIGFVLIVLIVLRLDYYLFMRLKKTIPKTYEKATQIVETVINLSQNMENCDNIQIPPLISYLNKYSDNKWNIEYIYSILTCVANGNMNQYLQDELFIPGNIQQSNLMVAFSDIQEQNKEIMAQTVSQQLVPTGYRFDENKSLVNQDEYQKQMVALNTQLQPVLSKINSIISTLEVYNDKGTIDFDETMKNLVKYQNMPDEELLNLICPQSEIISKKKTNKNEASIISDVYEFTKDTISLLYYLAKTVSAEAESDSENISAIYITRQWVWVLKDYFVKKIRYIEDIQIKTKRDITDFIKEVNRIKINLFDSFNLLTWLIPLNIFIIKIISSWVYILTNRIINKNSNTLPIESGRLAIEPPLKGGKSKKNKRKKRNTRKLNSKTKKIKRTRKSRKSRK